MVIGESIRTTLAEVWAHKLRSLLTLVGVVLGTMAIVVMLSLVEAVKAEVWRGIQQLGLDRVLFVSQTDPRSTLDAKRAHMSSGLRIEDADELLAASAEVQAVAPVAMSRQVVGWGDATRRVQVRGVTPSYREVFQRELGSGRFLSDLDLRLERRVAVVGFELAQRLFGAQEPVGQWVRLGHHRFQVIGVGAQLNNSFVRDGFSRREMEGVTVPLTTLQGLFTGHRGLDLMAVKAVDDEGLEALAAHLENRLWRQHNRVEDFEVENVASEILEARSQIDEQLGGWTVVFFAISAISIVVGGVGIFSVLQISLAERLYEIGLRKSIGAGDGDILVQFLIEAVFLSTMGAGLGLGIGTVLLGTLQSNFEFGLAVTPFAIGLAVAFAVGVGLLAGLYPSIRAARLTPVEALRG